jgi:hypothetical protein
MSGSAMSERRVIRAGNREALEQWIELHQADGLAVVEIQETGDDDWPYAAVLEQAGAQDPEGAVSQEDRAAPAVQSAGRKRK